MKPWKRQKLDRDKYQRLRLLQLAEWSKMPKDYNYLGFDFDLVKLADVGDDVAIDKALQRLRVIEQNWILVD